MIMLNGIVYALFIDCCVGRSEEEIPEVKPISAGGNNW
jgi:hypothetical protein